MDRILRVRVPIQLYQAIEDRAARDLSTVSQVVRTTLRDVFWPDQATLERCAGLVDTRTTYTTEAE